MDSFTKAFGSTELDAGALLMSVYDFLPATDERLRSTADRLIHTLGHKGLMYQFKWGNETLGVSEGAFAIASIWLAIHFIKLGRLDFAAEFIQAIVDSANHVGLLAEEIDAPTSHFLGNFPQLFVHTALIDAVHAFNTAAARKDRRKGKTG
ncbi:MAG: glycoside hydrolase family 15 protein [Actinomycetota bacterium]|nr:glycoside hydrolase family 15 protein [Actinomycetota bacterium]